MARLGAILPVQRDEIEAVISAIPFDLTDERTDKKHRFWADFMKRFLNPRQAVNGQITDSWMGFGVHAFIGSVIQPTMLLGVQSQRAIGQISYVEITRDNGDILVAASIPTKLGGNGNFVCRASSDYYAAVVRMAARTSF